MSWKNDKYRHYMAAKGVKSNKSKQYLNVIKNKEYYLNDIIIEYRDLIAKALKMTRKTNMEHGFSICRDEKGTHYVSKFKNTGNDGICVGEDYHVQMPGCKMPDGSDYAMEFHTHPDGTISGYFSGQDIRLGLMDKPDFLCLAVNKLDNYILTNLSEYPNTIANKNKAVITCWELIKDKNGKIIAWDEIEEFDTYWIDKRYAFSDWFVSFVKKVRNGESKLFKQTEYIIDIETGRTEYKG